MSKQTDLHLAIAASVLLVLLLACAVLQPTISIAETTPEPDEFVEEPATASSGPTETDSIAGSVRGADNEQGVVLYLPFDRETQTYQPELVILGATGSKLHRISIPGAGGPIRQWKRTCNGSRILVEMRINGEFELILVDPASGDVQVLEIPGIPSALLLDAATRGFKGGECFELLFDNANVHAYLVDTSQGEVIDLSTVDVGADGRPPGHIYGVVSDDDRYLVLWGQAGSWLIPTNSRGEARPLGEGRSFYGSFSRDSRWVVYSQGERIDGPTEVVVERIDGSESSTAIADRGPLYAIFGVDQKELIIIREDRLTVFDLNTGLESELLEFPYRSLRFLEMSPSREKLIVGNEVGREFTWYLIDLFKGAAKSLDDLSRYMPVAGVGSHGFVSDKRWPVVASPGQYGVLVPSEIVGILDLESGETRRILDLDTPSRIGILDSSADGRTVLFQAFPLEENSPVVLYILRSEGEMAQLVDATTEGGFSGSISPNGNWIAFAKSERTGDRVEMRLYFTDVEGTKVLPIVDGYYPIWARP